MIEDLLPGNIIVEECSRAEFLELLLKAETGGVISASTERRLEYIAGRKCARRALSRLGICDASIPVGRHGEPVWPPAIVGSITHCNHYCAAAVARAEHLAAIGIDAEIEGRVGAQVFNRITSTAERLLLPSSPGDWKTLVFSAKEAIYKAWFPLTRTWLGHLDVQIRPDSAGRFSAVGTGTRLGPHQWVVDSMQGMWGSRDQLVFAAAIVPLKSGRSIPLELL